MKPATLMYQDNALTNQGMIDATLITWYFLYTFWDNKTQPKLFPDGFQGRQHLRTEHTTQFFPLKMEKQRETWPLIQGIIEDWI